MGCHRLTYHQKTLSKTENTPIFVMGKKQGSDYQVFGMQMPGRSFNSGDYRYGYQGSEKDDEIKGEGNHYTTHFRQLDPRVGRWLSIDPLASSIPWQSPYVSMNNNPILNTDVYGDSIDVKDESGKLYRYRDDDNSFYDRDGNKYEGGSDIVDNIASELNKIQETARGKSLINTISGSKKIVEIASGKSNKAYYTSVGDKIYSYHLLYNPDQNPGIPTENGIVQEDLSWLVTAHELGHIEDFFLNGTENVEKAWINKGTLEEASYSEVYASHIENIIRAESGLALRTHYAVNTTDNVGASNSRLIDSNGKSLHNKVTVYTIRATNYVAGSGYRGNMIKSNKEGYDYKNPNFSATVTQNILDIIKLVSY